MKTFIINVSTNEQRKKHMLNIVEKNKCLYDFNFIHDGDIKDLSPSILNKFFTGEFSINSAAVSCAYKHILAYKAILDNNIDSALILEDDIYLSKNFCNNLSKIVTEIKIRNINNYLVSLEDSNLKYVPGSELKKNIFLYKQQTGRMTGSYLIDNKSTSNLLNEILAHKCNLPIDWFHNYCSSKELINIYWAAPTLATQGSLSGNLPSLIDNKKTGFIKFLKFRISRIYKRILYKMR